MKQTLLFGLVGAVLVAVVNLLGFLLGFSLSNALVAVGAGVILAVVRIGSPGARAGAFLVGYFATIIMFLVRALLLPTYWLGMMAYGVGIILLCTVVSALTRGRLPLFAMFTGAIVFAGVYEAQYIATQWYLATQLPTVATGLLVGVACGFITALIVELREPDPNEAAPMLPAEGGSPAAAHVPAQASATAGSPNAGLQVLDGSTGGNK